MMHSRIDKESRKAYRKKMMDDLKARLGEPTNPETGSFYYHPDEDHIVLSHALFWVMSKPLASKMPLHKGFLLLRQYEEELLEAYLTESEDYEELLDYCNTLFDAIPYIAPGYIEMGIPMPLMRKLSAMAIVAGGYGGDMRPDRADDLLDNIDFDRYGKVCCPEIERMLPLLNRFVEEEIAYLKK